MMQYPSIDREYIKDIHIYAMDKKDGNQIRVEWSAKRGFYKFGSKTQLIDKNAPIFGESVNLFLNKYEDDLSKIFKDLRWRNVVCFCEFYGENSFAGSHKEEQHDIVLFDISVDDAILEPRDFLERFEHLHIPTLVYSGNSDEAFIDAVRNSKIEGITNEGVVCKGPWDKKRNTPIMFKIKTNAWIEQLKKHCNGNMDLMARLL